MTGLSRRGTKLPAPLIDPRDRPTLADVLPSVLAPLGVPGLLARMTLPPVERTCVFLVDGLGLALLEMHRAETPFLNQLLDRAGPLVGAGFPTTTAASVASLGTGLPSGAHGIVGYTMHMPGADVVLECLSWHRYGGDEDLLGRLPPDAVQPSATLPQRARAAGVGFVVVSYAAHDGSGLTRAAFRGARYVGLPWPEDRAARLSALGDAFAAPTPGVVYTYYAGLDAAGHAYGVESEQWHDELRAVDRLAQQIAGLLPGGARLLITGDHGMVDLRHGDAGRVDLARCPELAADVRAFAGDPRMRHIHLRGGVHASVAREHWSERLGPSFFVLRRDEAIEAGLFGEVVRDEVHGRVGDLLVLAVEDVALFDSRFAAYEMTLVGHHGSLTDLELFVPLLRFDA